MQNRRQVLKKTLAMTITSGLAYFGFSNNSALAKTQVIDGIHHQDWFFETTFDLRKDLKNAEKNNKNLVLLWEQIGCVYCAQMHANVFTKADIVELINQSFEVVQMDMRGSRKFIGLDGIEATEAEIARNLVVNATPTTMFLDVNGDITFRAPGYVKPKFFKAIYIYVREKAYEKQTIFEWIKTHKFS